MINEDYDFPNLKSISFSITKILLCILL